MTEIEAYNFIDKYCVNIKFKKTDGVMVVIATICTDSDMVLVQGVGSNLLKTIVNLEVNYTRPVDCKDWSNN